MSQAPLLLVVIATRNRSRYAKSAIRALCSNIPQPDVEFIVQDSSDMPELGDYVDSECRDGRIRYHYTPPPVNMTENYNLALAAATGQYVAMIGDDDGVNPEIVDAARWAAANDVDCLTPLGVASYFWPDFRSRFYGGRHARKVYIQPFSSRLWVLDLQKAVRRCISNAAFGIEQWGLPKVYLGLVKRERLEELRRRIGCYFSGVSPDIFGAVSMAQLCERAFAVDYPLILGGNSGGSNAGLSAAGRHKGTFEEAVHMKNYSVADWPDGLPRYWVPETAYANSALVALGKLGRPDLVREFNYPLLHARCGISYPDYSGKTAESFQRSLRVMGIGRARGLSLVALATLQEVSRRSWKVCARLRKPRPNAGAFVLPQLNSVEEAVRALSIYLVDKSQRLTLGNDQPVGTRPQHEGRAEIELR